MKRTRSTTASSTEVVTIEESLGEAVRMLSSMPIEEEEVVPEDDDVDEVEARSRVLRAWASEEHLALGDETEFQKRFETVEQIGRGAFSVVRLCRDASSGEEVAVKSIDMRPLRLRSDFSPRRLLREATILSRLDHPNIVAFKGCYEGPECLRLVMERLAGRELFQVILEREALDEPAAKVVLRQLASALAYLHARRIVHRDVKPENVFVLDDDEQSPTVKLIDFGLSKVVDNSTELEEDFHLEASVAKTFVGTPCYLAPEIEQIHRGAATKRFYGVEVDAWSLGAVLYVMLVARFPEFDRSHGRQQVKTDAPYWSKISPEAKHLVSRLMTYEASKRLACRDALDHSWLGGGHQIASSPAALVAPPPAALTARGSSFEVESLLDLQQTIAVCLNNARSTYGHDPEISATIRKCVVMCRAQFLENTKLLKHIEHTASSVLDIHDDLELAVDTGQLALAHDLLRSVRTWVTNLRVAVTAVQAGNKDQIMHLHAAISQVERTRPLLKPPDDDDVVDDDSEPRPVDPIGLCEDADMVHGPLHKFAQDTDRPCVAYACAAVRHRLHRQPAANRAAPSARSGCELFRTALDHLERVDVVLERLALLWGNTEVIFDLIIQKSEHIDKFVDYTAEPKLADRFRHRLHDYKRFWLQVHDTSRTHLANSRNPLPADNPPIADMLPSSLIAYS
ncbi:hypothetical protein CTAYLR_006821 [Chrysophaeum taylorii]|uniref:Protein kinase domain-containing protein n=1 Tax=Chrysophaeum taylorii TaxID=2483200 RepID=A0AAD7XMX6_9STRA|nr:hypothetical protein CTAYLR_006821 [Chrysophaeum taylorii]